jgi:hypothetical protein
MRDSVRAGRFDLRDPSARSSLEVRMPETRTSPTVEQERAKALLHLGFNATQAFLLAATRHGGGYVETAEVERLLQAGCPHETALRILL